jgi:hypothetical protein
MTIEENGCWIWNKSLDKDGYGKTYSLKYNTNRAHVLSYIVFRGVFDRNLLICHTCNNPSCVNPKHLYAGTHTENMADRTINEKGIEGIKNPKNKLTEQQVREIRALIPHLTLAEIAKSYNVYATAIYKIKHKQTWRNLK